MVRMYSYQKWAVQSTAFLPFAKTRQLATRFANHFQTSTPDENEPHDLKIIGPPGNLVFVPRIKLVGIYSKPRVGLNMKQARAS